MGLTSSANVIIPKAFLEYDVKEFKNSRQVGEGGFSTVWHANHQKLGGVAIKELKEYVRKEDFREAFLLFEKINHRYIIRIFGILAPQKARLSRSPVYNGIVMEFMEMGSLEKVIHDHSKEYESKQIYRWIYFISNGLNYLHEEGIIHRDINPSNILLGQSLDDLRISDFGLARQLDTEGSYTTWSGTMAYMAPEILRKQRYSKPADIYSLVITIWEIIDRSKPYCQFSGFEFISEVLAGRRPEIVTQNSLKRFFSLVSPAENELIQKLLNKGWDGDPANRPYARAFLDFSRRMAENSMGNQLEGFNSSTLILGGYHGSKTDSICIFDSKENKWRMCKQILPFKVAGHGSVILNDKIYFMGGHTNNSFEPLASCYKLGENGEWTKMAEMNEKRNYISQSTIVFGSEIWVIGGCNRDDRLKTVEKYNPQTNIWTKMPDLNFERSSSSASIMGGKIFVSSGWDGNKYLKSVEVYDPAKNKWEIFCDMPLELSYHCSIVEGTNLIIIGGVESDETPLDEVWKIDVLDPKKEWIRMPSLKQGRFYHGAVKLSNGIMVFGGSIDYKTRIDSVEIFDGTSWTEGPKLPEKHGVFSSFPLSIKTEKQLLLQYFGDKILERRFEKQLIEMRQEVASSELGFHSSALILGGFHNSFTDSICIFDSKKNKWRRCKQKLPFKVAKHGSAILNGKIYIMGGKNDPKVPLASCYKLGENGEWTKMADMNEKRTGISQSTIVFGSEIWVIGGWNGNAILKTVEKYNPQTNIWTKMPDLNFKRGGSFASIIGGKIFVYGGWDRMLRKVEVYDPAKNEWEIFCDMPLELIEHCSIVEGTNLLIIGGRKYDGTPSDEVWKIDVFDPKKEWIKMPSLKQRRFYHGAVRLSNGIMVFGGIIDKKTRIDSVEIFDGISWKEGPNLPEKHGVFSYFPLSIKTETQFLLQLC